MSKSMYYDMLIKRLDQFIRKFYYNQIIRGFLYTIGFISLYFLAIALLENYFYFGIGGRKILFYSFLAATLYTSIRWIIIPAAKYFHLGPTISNEQAAHIIGDHFPSVKDKLLNILQLNHQATQTQDPSLILAGIEQKTREIQPVPFKSAIDLSKNRKYLKFALPPVLLLVVLLFAAPSLIRNPAQRLIQNNKEFEREAPFTFQVLNKNMAVAEFEPFELKVRLDGKTLPDQLELIQGNTPFKLVKTEDGTYSHMFNNVQDDILFHLRAAGFDSKDYRVEVLKKAGMTQLSIKLYYPAYTGRKNEVVDGAGDLIVPFGTKINWTVGTRLATSVQMDFAGFAPVSAQDIGSGRFAFLKTALTDQDYKILIGNKELPKSDSLAYSLRVIRDEAPVITLDKYADSSNQKLVYLSGNVSDDYGISRLVMVQQIRNQAGAGKTKVIPIEKPATKQGFYSHLYDINSLKLQPGDELTYYFEVFDNDGVSGPKSARTSVMTFKRPSVSELEKKLDQTSKEIQSDLQKTLNESKKIDSELQKLKEKLLQQKSLSWQDKEKFEQLLQKQKDLQDKLKETQQKLEEKQKVEEEIKTPDPEQQEKQDKLNEMLKELQNPEEQKLMDKIKELLDKLDKKESIKQLEQMSQKNEQQNKSLDRLMELLKQLELENKVKETSEKLEKLADKEEKLADKTDKQAQDQESLKKEQEEVKKEFEEIKKKMDEIQKENKELDTPKKLEDQKEEQEKTDQDMQDAKQDLEKKDNKSASKKQKSAAKKMKDMAKNMQNMMAASDKEQIELDMQAIRQLLENIIGLSFNQEGLIGDFNKTTVNTPRYVTLVRDQLKVKTDFKMVDDSLHELSKRVYQIEEFITRKVGDINTNLDVAMDNLNERQKPQAGNNQQLAMTNLNDLALMLSEVLQQMQMEAAQSMPGSQMCNKPGGDGASQSGKKSKDGQMPQMDKITQGQQKMNEQMKGQMERMKQGQKPGSQGYGELAAQQAKLRKALQDIDNQMRQNGQGKKQLQEIIDAMDKIEKDLVNKRLTNEMMNRQEQILVRLLEEERAQREQDQEEKRRATVADPQQNRIPSSMQEYIKKKEAGIDEFRPVYPALTPYYKRLVEQYYNQLSGK